MRYLIAAIALSGAIVWLPPVQAGNPLDEPLPALGKGGIVDVARCKVKKFELRLEGEARQKALRACYDLLPKAVAQKVYEQDLHDRSLTFYTVREVRESLYGPRSQCAATTPATPCL